MNTLTKYEALQYWKQERETFLQRFWIEGHILFTVYCNPVSLKSNFEDQHVLRLSSASSCIRDAYVSAHCISRWSELDHSFPSVFFY